jgi:hypothetical protein
MWWSSGSSQSDRRDILRAKDEEEKCKDDRRAILRAKERRTMGNERKVTRVRIEYDDGSAQEVQGAEDCAEWVKLVDAHAGLWMSRGWVNPGNPKWIVFGPPMPTVPEDIDVWGRGG